MRETEGVIDMIPMEVKTEKGVKYFSYGFIFYIIALVILLVVLISVLGSISSMVSDPDNVDESDALGALAGLIAGICLGIFIIIVALALFLMGLINIHAGNKEFGPQHEKTSNKGAMFIFIGIIVNFIGAAVGGIGSSIVGVVVAIFLGMGLLYLIYEIADEKTKNLLWIAMIIYVIVAIIMAVVMIWIYTSYDFAQDEIEQGSEVDEAQLDSAMGMATIALGVSSLGLIPMAIFFWAYWKTYLRIKNREIQPVPTYPAVPPPPPYPPAYGPPQYPPPQYPPPQYPPPAYPPPYP
jgi:hypothetical protein